MHLTQQQIEKYNTDGFLTGLKAVDAAQAVHYQEQYNVLEKELGREKCATGLLDRHFDQKFIWEIAVQQTILDVVQSLIGPDILLLATHFFSKYGPSDKYVAWHQDVTYWGLDPAVSITAWYALDDSDPGNGCMRAIPGTHKSDIVEHTKSGSGKNLLSADQQVVVPPALEEKAVDLILKAGEFSLHDGKVIHGSEPNPSHRRRSGLTLRYIPPSVKQIEGSGRPYRAILVRGKDQFNHFVNEPMPF